MSHAVSILRHGPHYGESTGRTRTTPRRSTALSADRGRHHRGCDLVIKRQFGFSADYCATGMNYGQSV
jgi:hypothetical protein